MTTVTVKAPDSRGFASGGFTSGSPTRMGFLAYVTMLRSAFAEALQKTQEARRKYPFADI